MPRRNKKPSAHPSPGQDRHPGARKDEEDRNEMLSMTRRPPTKPPQTKAPMAPKNTTPTVERQGGVSKVAIAATSSTTSKLLDSLHLNTSARVDVLMMSPSAVEYLKVSEQVYDRVTRTMNAGKLQMPRFVFMHIAKLWWTRRIEDVCYAETGRKPPAAQRTSMPRDMRIPQPLWDILRSIGVTEDKPHSVKYIPTQILPESMDKEEWSIDYLIALADCYAIDYLSTWDKTEQWLEKQERVTQEGVDREDATWEEQADDLELLEKRLSVLQQEMRKAEKAKRRPDPQPTKSKWIRNGILYRSTLKVPDYEKVDYENLPTTMTSEDLDTPVLKEIGSWGACVDSIMELKSRITRFRPQQQKEFRPAPGLEYDDQDAGSYGSALGMSPALWRAWSEMSCAWASVYQMSLSFPSETDGAFNWILPVTKDNGSYFARLPRSDIPPAEWKLALMVPLARWDKSLNPDWTGNWITYTDYLSPRDVIVTQWIQSFITKELPATVYYTNT